MAKTTNHIASTTAEEQALFEHYTVKVDKGQRALRIDKYLTIHMEKKTRSQIQNAIRANCILVNGKPVKSNYKIRPLDDIALVLPKPPTFYEIKGENIPIPIVYEDADVIVVQKPMQMVVHPSFGHYSGTLVHALLYHFTHLPIAGSHKEAQSRPGLVHRLDKDTTGLMVVAKTEYAMSHLAKQFFDRTVVRRYWALVWGDLEEEEGTITGHIGRNPRNRKKMYVFPEGEQGKHAVTHYKVLKRFGYVTLVECRLETGRTHQIRVHFKHIGHPLFGDKEYGGDKVVKGTVYTKYKQFVENCFKLLPRQALHAKVLGFIHPETKEERYFESELPEDIKQVLEKWNRYRGKGG